LQLNSRKQLLLLLEEDCVHVADSDSTVLCYTWGTLPEEEDYFQGSPLDHFLTAAVKTALGQVRIPCWGWIGAERAVTNA
jgi:hypothetical protein